MSAPRQAGTATADQVRAAWQAQPRARREWAIVALVGVVVFTLLTLAATRRGSVDPGLLNAALFLMVVYALFALGLQLQFGFAGLLNIGHVGFAAVGAYAFGVASLRGLPLTWGIGLGLLAAVALAVVVGVPTLRLREDYLAIVTIGTSELVRLVVTAEEWLTQGPLGILTFPRPGVAWATSSPRWLAFAEGLGVKPYPLLLTFLALTLLAVAYLALASLADSPWGRVLKAVREDEDVAQALGKATFRFKLQALALGAIPAALFGMAFAWSSSLIHPSIYLPLVTFYGWIIVVVGGVGSLRGVLAGSLVLWGLFTVAQNARLATIPVAGAFLEATLGFLTTPGPGQLLLVGLLLVVIVMVRPQGILGRKEELRFAR